MPDFYEQPIVNSPYAAPTSYSTTTVFVLLPAEQETSHA